MLVSPPIALHLIILPFAGPVGRQVSFRGRITTPRIREGLKNQLPSVNLAITVLAKLAREPPGSHIYKMKSRMCLALRMFTGWEGSWTQKQRMRMKMAPEQCG